MSRVEAFLAVSALLLAGCFMSLDENRWKTDSRGDRAARDLPRDLPDAPADRPSVDRAPAEGPAPDSRVDAKPADGPRPDAKKLDGPRPDTKKLDAPKPDAKKPDLLKPDLPKPDQPKPPDLPANCVSMALTLQAGPDDGELWPPDFFPDGETPGNEIYIGHDGGDPMWGYFRFALGQAIPAGSTISSATLSLWGVGVWQWGMMKAIDVRAELAADAPAVTGAGNAPGGGATARPVTAALVRWPASGGLSWSSGQYNTTPSLAPLLQEIVNAKSGLASGAHLQLWLRSSQSGDGAVITPDFQATGYAGHPAKLSIVFCK